MNLDALEEFVELASPAPWFNIKGSLEFRNAKSYGGASIGAGPNAQFIAAARTALPLLIAVARAGLEVVKTCDAFEDDAEGSTTYWQARKEWFEARARHRDALAALEKS